MPSSYDLIIVGGGPAGITAGIYASRYKLNTLLVTKDFGGQMGRTPVAIENYPGFESILGPELIRKFEQHLRTKKIDIEKDRIREVKKKNDEFIVVTEGKKEFKAQAVIVATGADPRPLQVPGEKEFIGRGVSYCSHCDGPLFSDKIVAIAGGGNSALGTALFLASIAKKIYILEAGEKARADAENQERVQKTGKAEIITSAVIKEIRGDKFVDSLIYQNLKEKKERTLEVEGVFVEIGLQPAVSAVKGLVDFNENDEIKIDPETCRTKTDGLFAAGDVAAGQFKQIIIACGQGARAALAAFQYLQAANLL